MKQQSYVLVLISILLTCGIVHKSNAAPYKYVSTDSLWKQVKANFISSPELALEYAKQLEGEAKKNNNIEQQANALWAMGYINYEKRNLVKSVEAYFRVLPIYKTLGNKKYLANTYLNTAIIFTDIKNHKPAEAFYINALNLFVQIDDKKGIAKAEVYLGREYVYMKSYEKAKRHLQTGLDLSKDYNKKLINKAHNLMGYLEIEKNNYPKAIEYYELALKHAIKDNDTKEELVALYNLGEVHSLLNNIKQAMEYASKSLALSKSIENTSKQIKPQILLAEIAYKQKGGNIAEVNALVTTVGDFNKENYNAYLQEGLYYLSEDPQQNILEKTELKEMMKLLAAQGRLSSALYEKTKILLNQHSLQLSIDKVKNEQRLEALEESDKFKNWAFGISALLLIAIVVWVWEHSKYKRTIAKKSFDSNIEKAEKRISKIVKNIGEKNILNIEQEAESEEEAMRNMGLAEELKMLKNEKEEHAEQLENMTADLIKTNTTMQEMNRYVWEIFKDINQQGYKLLPPPWHLGDDRDN